MKKSRFITLEGIDGAGKSTHVSWIQSFLEKNGVNVVMTREPGGTPLGEKLREILLHESMALETEALLMFASRAEHLSGLIRPALDAGKWVLSDRFTDASFAYQGGGRGMGSARLSVLEKWVQDGFQPDLTLLFDVPLEVARNRLNANASLDRFELEKGDFFGRVRFAYLERAGKFPDRFRVIDSTRSLAEIRQELESILSALL